MQTCSLAQQSDVPPLLTETAVVPVNPISKMFHIPQKLSAGSPTCTMFPLTVQEAAPGLNCSGKPSTGRQTRMNFVNLLKSVNAYMLFLSPFECFALRSDSMECSHGLCATFTRRTGVRRSPQESAGVRRSQEEFGPSTQKRRSRR